MLKQKKDIIQVQGSVIELLPNTVFKVRLTDPKEYKDKIVMAYLSGKMRLNYIRILPSDMVKIEISPYNLNKGRIVYRM